jgi:hypothetical protein
LWVFARFFSPAPVTSTPRDDPVDSGSLARSQPRPPTSCTSHPSVRIDDPRQAHSCVPNGSRANRRITVNRCGAREVPRPRKNSSETPEEPRAGSTCHSPPLQGLVGVMPRVIRGTAKSLVCFVPEQVFDVDRVGVEGSSLKTLCHAEPGVEHPRCSNRRLQPSSHPHATRRGGVSYRGWLAARRGSRECLARAPGRTRSRELEVQVDFWDSRRIHASPLVLRYRP